MWWHRERDLRADLNRVRAEQREDMREVWAQFRRVSDALKASQAGEDRWQRSKVSAAVIGAGALITAKLIEVAPRLIEALAAFVGAPNAN